ncbi:MAG: pilus assembly protein FimV, partial [Bdellovibrionales bacterium]|nr:pilus assembly protein FimV [Massilia sp.]
ATTPTDGGKTASTEDRMAKEKALAEATARVKELERNVSELEKLMVIKNKAAAEAQKAPPAAVVPPVAARVTPPVTAPAPSTVVAAPAGSTAAPGTAATVATVAKPAVVAPAADAPAAAKPASKVAVLKKSSDVPAEPGLVDLILEHALTILAALVALAALIGGVLFMKNRRRSDSSSSNESSILGAPTDQAHSLFAETGGQSVDTSNSVFNSSFAPSASQLDTNEVDPVAEADVYIAYGRDAQAEEILKEALRTHPERYPVRLKLLEIYAARKDLRGFETQATDLYSQTKGQGDEWAQAAALGLAIDPANPLYASAANSGPSTIIPATDATPVTLEKRDTPAVMDELPTSFDTSTLETAVPAPAAKLADDHTLDFDLGGLSFEPAAAAPAAVAAGSHDTNITTPSSVTPGAVQAKADEPFDMAFNMDFDTPAAVTAPAASVQHAKALDDISLDLASNDFSAEYAASGKDDLSGMGDLASSFNIPPAPASHHAPADNALDFGSMDLDLPDSATAPKAASFDMSGIDLSLPGVDGGDADLSALHMEMETKLDLAIAYQEIGDKEGARELLDEVIKGGSGDQAGKASEMRAKLA